MNYQNSKIYKIECKTTGLKYIGSTTIKYLCDRLGQHTHLFRNGNKRKCASGKIINNGNYYIELIELYPCNNRTELNKKEQYYINTIECVNINNAFKDKQEYRNEHKEKQKLYMAEYYKQNKQKMVASASINRNKRKHNVKNEVNAEQIELEHNVKNDNNI
jgi:hypothetical protein